MGIRKILHIDFDAFFCSVEELINPNLRGKPFAVGGHPEERGVISSCSYPARTLGIKSAMPSKQALQLFPKLVIIKPNHDKYKNISDAVFDDISDFVPVIEQISIDEAFLDHSDSTISSLSLSQTIQRLINSKYQLPCSIGGGSNKLIAKIATDQGKSTTNGANPPNAILIIDPGEEADFLSPLTVSALWGVGPKTEKILAGLGISTVGELAVYPANKIKSLFGKTGEDLIAHAKGIDDRPLITTHVIKSISQEITFSRDTSNRDVINNSLHNLVKKVGFRLREANQVCNTIKLKLRWANFKTITRQHSSSQAIDKDQDIFNTAHSLLTQNWDGNQAIRLIGIGVSNLHRPEPQICLWDNQIKKENDILLIVDNINRKLGKGIITIGFSGKDK